MDQGHANSADLTVCSFYSCRAHRALHSFPTRRSSDLLKSRFPEKPEAWRRLDVAIIQHVIVEEVCQLRQTRSEEHTSELQSRFDLVCRLLLEKKKITDVIYIRCRESFGSASSSWIVAC